MPSGPFPFTKKEEAGSSLTTGRQEVTCFYPNIQIPGYAWGGPSSMCPTSLFSLLVLLYISFFFFFFFTKQSLFLSERICL